MCVEEKESEVEIWRERGVGTCGDPNHSAESEPVRTAPGGKRLHAPLR